MGKLQNIKKAIQNAPDNDATRAIKYLLWYIESQDRQLDELTDAFRCIAKHGETENNFSNWIGNKRHDVNENAITIEEYNQWLKIASENNGFVVVAGKKVPRRDPR